MANITSRNSIRKRIAGVASVQSRGPLFIMAALLLVLGFFLIYPILLILMLSFNTSGSIFFGERVWGLENWQVAFQEPRVFDALRNTVMIWALVVGISFPIATIIAWVLARTNVPMSNTLEVVFWVSFMMPGLATTLSWITLMDPSIGMFNKALEALPFVDNGPFNIYSVPGIVWAHIMANGVSTKVMLLTPAFRNMDSRLEEQARVGGASNFMTMVKITLPLMVSPMVLIFSLQLLRLLSGFEIEYLLGIPIGFFVYSTLIFELVSSRTPALYGEATVLASMTLIVVTLIIPFQRWVSGRRRYTTITGSFKPGLLDLGPWKYVFFGALALLLLALTILPAVTLIIGSFMNRAGYFTIDPVFSMRHWEFVWADNFFWVGIKTTLIISTAAAFGSPLLFVLLAYILVRTKWRGRILLDMIIWASAAIPGILTGLGLLLIFLGTPGLSFLFGSIWALIIVVLLQGNTTGVNISKGVLLQVGNEIEEAARISGAGWTRTFLMVMIPILMPTLILLAMINFVSAAGATSSVVLLASRSTMTLSLVALDYATGDYLEEASAVSIIIMAFTTILVFLARWRGLRMSVHH
jgi:iron(III) transport system permease protein